MFLNKKGTTAVMNKLCRANQGIFWVPVWVKAEAGSGPDVISFLYSGYSPKSFDFDTSRGQVLLRTYPSADTLGLACKHQARE